MVKAVIVRVIEKDIVTHGLPSRRSTMTMRWGKPRRLQQQRAWLPLWFDGGEEGSSRRPPVIKDQDQRRG
jgi:hypothetical protein